MKKTLGMMRMTVAAALLSACTARADLRAAWEFNPSDISGASVSASGGTAAKTTGVLAGDADVSTGILALDGTGDYLAIGGANVTDVTDLRALPMMTICAWVRVGDTVTTQRRIVEHDDNFYFFQETGKFRFTVHGSGNPTAISVSSSTPNVWQHVLAVYQGQGRPLKIYINGTLEHTTGNAQVMSNSVQRFTIGASRNNSATAGNAFNGSLDDVAIWDTILSDAQIAELAGLGTGGYAGRVPPTLLGTGSGIATRPAIAITKTTATLRALLGVASSSVRLYWGESDGGDGAWDQTCDFGASAPGLLSTNLTGLTAGTLYHYRFVATTPGGEIATETGCLTTFRVLPDDFGGLQLWLRPDAGVFSNAGTTPAFNGGAVGQWNDVSGNSRHAERTAGGGVLVLENNAFNDLPGIRRTDANNSAFLTIPSYEIADTDELTVFVISRAAPQASGGTIHPLITSGPAYRGTGMFTITSMNPLNGGSGMLGFFGRDYNPFPYDDYTSSSNSPNFSDGEGHVIALSLAGTATGGNGAFTGWYDGKAGTPRSGRTSNPVNGPVEIGGASDNAGYRYAGTYGDILIYNRVLTDDERNDVGWYLQEKYGLKGAYRNKHATLIKQYAAEAVTKTAATLTAELLDGDLPATATLYWGPEDGGTDPTAWANAQPFDNAAYGLLSTNLTGLTTDATYHYRFCGRNNQGDTWTSASGSFKTWRELPSDITDLQLWLKADDGVTSDSRAVVMQWDDHSGFDRHAARVSTHSLSNVVYERDSLNGMPIIRTKDIINSDYLRAASYTVADDDDLTVFIVSRADPQTLNGSALHTLITSGDPANGKGAFGISAMRPNAGGAGHLGFFGRGNQLFPYNQFTSTNQTPNFSDQKGHVMALRLTGASAGGNGVFSGWYDGAFTTSLNGSNNNPTNGPVEIGGATGSSEYRYAGSFGDILIYNRALTDDERNRVGWHLQTKYGLPGAYRNPFAVKFANPAVTALATTAATLAIDIIGGDLPSAVTIHYGTSDGGTDAAAWAGAQTGDTVSAFGAASASITGLTPGTIYHARFSATNSQGRAWADTGITFATDGPPIVATGIPNLVGLTSAILEGTLLATNGAPTHVWIYWGTEDGGDTAGGWQNAFALGVQDVGSVSMPAPLTGLTEDTSYAFRLYATNSYGGRWAPTSQRFTTAYMPDNIKTDGLVLWLCADMGVAHTGGLVDQWQDQAIAIGGANNATRAGSSRPTLEPDAINGRAALRFDGIDDFLTIPDDDSLDLGTGAGKGWTLFTVYLRNGGNNPCIISKGMAGSSDTDWRLFQEGSQIIWGTGNASDTNAWLQVREPAVGTPHILAATLTQTGETSGTKVLYTNGVPHVSETYQQKAPASTAAVYIGGYSATERNIAGLIAEIMAFNRALTEDELNNVGWYLQEKYGILGLFEYRTPRGTLLMLR